MRTVKSTILALALILITAIVFCSCNLDATDGIYSEIADSTESTNVTVKSYLGQYSGEYYYLTDEAVFKIGSSDPIFKGTDTSIVRGASLIDTAAGAFLVLRENRETLQAELSYYANPEAEAAVLGSFNGLLANGLFYDSTKIYRCNAGAAEAVVSDVSVQYSLTTGDYSFFSVRDAESNYKFYVIKADGTVVFNGITGTSKTYVGFQPLPGETDFLLLNYDSSKAKSNLYLLESGDSEVTTDVYTTLKSSIPYAYSTQAASFIYTDAESNTYIVFKCSSYFDKVKISAEESERTVTQISTGFAANLRTAEITNILDTDTAGVFIAGTVDSMLYEINVNEDTSTQRK